MTFPMISSPAGHMTTSCCDVQCILFPLLFFLRSEQRDYPMTSHKNVTLHLTLLALRFDMFTSGMGHQRFTDSLRYLIYHTRTDKIFRSQKSCSSLIRFPSGSFLKTHHVQVGVEPHVTCGFQDLIAALFYWLHLVGFKARWS